MDDNSSNYEIKQDILDEINERKIDFTSVERVKVENDVDWSIQNMLDFYQFQENESIHTKLEVKKEGSSNIDYCRQDVLNGNYQDKISYEELKEDNLQNCMFCGMYFPNSYAFFCHNLIHLKVPLTRQSIYLCAHCPKHYKKKNNLKYHILIEHYNLIVRLKKNCPVTKQMRKCLICNKTYKYSSWLSHMTEVHCQYKFKCKKCNLSFKASRYLKRHYLLIHEKTKIYKGNVPTKERCTKCPAVLDSKYALTTHIRNCHSDERFTCHICKSTLKCRAYLLTHIKRVHDNDGVIHTCSVCSKDFKSNRYLRIHVRNAHIKKGKL